MTHILVVDDNAVQQRILGHMLRKAGYEVEIAGDAFEALDLVMEETFDLAIVDIAMPDMDGVELLIALREQPATSLIPVVMLTASSRDEDHIRARDAGADAFLTKPASSGDLLATVESILAGQ